MKSKEINIKEIVLEAEALSKTPASAQLTSALRWVERQTHTRTNHAQMLVGKDEGLFSIFLYYFCYFYWSNWSNRSKKEVFQGVDGFLLMVQFGQIGQKDIKPA